GIKPDTAAHACHFNGNNYIADVGSNPQPYMLPGATAASTTTVGVLSVGSTIDSAAADCYWRYHHTGNPGAGCSGGSGVASGAGWPASTTRFQAYCQELGLGSDCQGTNTPPSWATGTEAHGPQCSSSSTGDYKRRLISVAIVNCVAQNVQ